MTDPRILVGANTADDAAAFRLDNKTAIIQTVDYFTPIVELTTCASNSTFTLAGCGVLHQTVAT